MFDYVNLYKISRKLLSSWKRSAKIFYLFNMKIETKTWNQLRAWAKLAPSAIYGQTQGDRISHWLPHYSFVQTPTLLYSLILHINTGQT